MLKVIIADDEQKVNLLLQKIVDWEKLGYQIAGTANDGERALQLIEEEKPDVLMTDIRMPGVDGMELIRRAKEIRPDLVFIVVSGYRQFEYAQTALKYGVTDYLLKPVNAEELTQLLIRIREEEEKKRRLDNWTASVDRQLRENEWKKREQLVDNLKEYAQENRELNDPERLNQEYGCDFHEGTYQVIVIKPDIPSAQEHADAYRIMMKRSLSMVQKALEQFADESAAAVHAEGIMVVIYKKEYDPVQLRQFLTRVRREIENQRDLFWGIIVTMAMGGEKHRMQELPQSMKEAVQLCKNRITGGKGGWLSWDDGDNETREDYEMLPEERKYFQEIGEYLDSKKNLHGGCQNRRNHDSSQGIRKSDL